MTLERIIRDPQVGVVWRRTQGDPRQVLREVMGFLIALLRQARFHSVQQRPNSEQEAPFR